MEREYQFVNGTAYHKETCREVINWLETSREREQRIRIFYGDTKTGIDWHEEYDTIGHIGRSTGKIKIPILIKNSRSMGGTAILDHCIVKITTKSSSGKIETVYLHNKYRLYKESISVGFIPENKYPYSVYIDGKNQANFKTGKQAENYQKFLQGERNKM